jgi:hypothetical protein
MLSSAQRRREPAQPTREPAAAPPAAEPNLRARFIPLAESRTAAVIAALDYLGQLSQRARYRYTDEEVNEVEAALMEKLSETMDAFRRGVGNRPGFKFRAGAKGGDGE